MAVYHIGRTKLADFFVHVRPMVDCFVGWFVDLLALFVPHRQGCVATRWLNVLQEGTQQNNEKAWKRKKSTPHRRASKWMNLQQYSRLNVSSFFCLPYKHVSTKKYNYHSNFLRFFTITLNNNSRMASKFILSTASHARVALVQATYC